MFDLTLHLPHSICRDVPMKIFVKQAKVLKSQKSVICCCFKGKIGKSAKKLQKWTLVKSFKARLHCLSK